MAIGRLCESFYGVSGMNVRMYAWLRRVLRVGQDERAVTTLEYGLIAGAVAVVALRGFATMMGNLSTKFVAIGLKLT